VFVDILKNVFFFVGKPRFFAGIYDSDCATPTVSIKPPLKQTSAINGLRGLEEWEWRNDYIVECNHEFYGRLSA